MEMHRRLWLARRARGEAEQRDIVAAGLDRLEPHRLVQRHAIELGVMVRGAVEIDDLLEELAGLGAGDQFIGDAAVGQRQRDLRLVDDLASTRTARSIGMVLTTTAPALVAASQAATSAGLLPERISTRLPGFTP